MRQAPSKNDDPRDGHGFLQALVSRWDGIGDFAHAPGHVVHRRQFVLRANISRICNGRRNETTNMTSPAHQGSVGRSLVPDDDRLDRGRRGLIPTALGGHRSVGAGDGARRFARAGVGTRVRMQCKETLLAIHLQKRHTWDPEQPLVRALGVRDRAPQGRRRLAPRPAEGRTAREF